MNKSHAIELLGGSVTSAARACEISTSAVSQWPEVLTKDQIVRVQAALYRQQNAKAKPRRKAETV
jgi:hypothetical protein